MRSIFSSNDRLNPTPKAQLMFTGSYMFNDHPSFSITGSYKFNPDPGALSYLSSSVVSNNTPQFNITDKLLDQIESLNFELMDSKDAAGNYRAVHDNLVLRNQELEARLEGYHARDAISDTEKDKHTEAQYKILELTRHLETEIGNRDHFRSLVSQQDTFINELKLQIEKWKEAKIKEIRDVQVQLTSKTEQADHLAKQTVRLNNENAALKEKADKFDLMLNEFASIKKEFNTLTTETSQFKEQNNRLLEENRKLHDKAQDLDCNATEHGSLCGGCLSCQLMQAEHALELVNAAASKAQADLKSYMTINEYQFAIIGIMKPFVAGVVASRWFGDSKAERIIQLVEDKQILIATETNNLLHRVMSPGVSVREIDNSTNKDHEYEIPKKNQYLTPK